MIEKILEIKNKSNYAIKHKIKSNQTIVLVTHNIPQLKHL